MFVENQAFVHDKSEAACGAQCSSKIHSFVLFNSTFQAGDRSLSNVVAHEIAHSWTGNLVTNRTWEHFWLNEGHTVFVERKIVAKLAGASGGACRQLHMLGGRWSLTEEVKRRGQNSAMTVLVPNLDVVDPDDSFSCVPYEKGSALLYFIETLVGEGDVSLACLLASLKSI